MAGSQVTRLRAPYGEGYLLNGLQCARRDSGHCEEGVDHPCVPGAGHRDARLLQPLGVSLPFVSQWITLRSNDQRRRQTPPPEAGITIGNLATLYRQRGRFDEAEPLFRRSIDMLEQTARPDGVSLMTALNNAAELYRSQGKLSPAEQMAERALNIAGRLSKDDVRRSHPLHTLACVYQSMGRAEEARRLFLEALDLRERSLGPEHPHLASTLTNLASLYLAEGNLDAAGPLAERAVSILEKTLGPEHPNTAVALNNLAQYRRLRGLYAKAERLYRRALSIWEHSGSTNTKEYAVALENLANLFQDIGRKTEAARLRRTSTQAARSFQEER